MKLLPEWMYTFITWLWKIFRQGKRRKEYQERIKRMKK